MRVYYGVEFTNLFQSIQTIAYKYHLAHLRISNTNHYLFKTEPLAFLEIFILIFNLKCVGFYCYFKELMTYIIKS